MKKFILLTSICGGLLFAGTPSASALGINFQGHVIYFPDSRSLSQVRDELAYEFNVDLNENKMIFRKADGSILLIPNTTGEDLPEETTEVEIMPKSTVLFIVHQLDGTEMDLKIDFDRSRSSRKTVEDVKEELAGLLHGVRKEELTLIYAGKVLKDGNCFMRTIKRSSNNAVNVYLRGKERVTLSQVDCASKRCAD